MADMTTYSVSSTSTEAYGRTINRARSNYFVIDSPNGPGEALGTAEAFLAGIAACGVSLVEGAAKTEGIPYGRLNVDITSYRTVEHPEDFHHIDIDFLYDGPTLEQAEKLTEIWKAR